MSNPVGLSPQEHAVATVPATDTLTLQLHLTMADPVVMAIVELLRRMYEFTPLYLTPADAGAGVADTVAVLALERLAAAGLLERVFVDPTTDQPLTWAECMARLGSPRTLDGDAWRAEARRLVVRWMVRRTA